MDSFVPMHRRGFFQMAARGAVAAAALGVERLPGANAGEAPRSISEVGDVSLSALRSVVASGGWTAQALTEQFLARIEALDRNGPGLRSVIELNPDAVAIARRLDGERPAGGAKGALHGIPVLIKDNIDTRDRMSTTAGSLALDGVVATEDAFLVRRLREAGAVILGKTNLSEWANFRSPRSTSGWSGRGGLTRNPYALDRNPSGSSSGSAVAVAAGLCAVAVGTETDGSIMSPSSVCGIVGIKPTVGLVSRSGIIPISATQDTAGPMGRTVEDAAILLGVLAGEDPRDPATAAAAGKGARDYTQFLDRDGLKGARIGVARRFFRMHPGAMRLAEAQLGRMRELGAVLVDPADLPSHGRFGDAEYEVLLHEFKAGLNAHLERLGPGAPVRTLKEVIDFNHRESARELAHFGQETLILAESRGSLHEPVYREALARCRTLSRTEGLDAVLDRHRLDAIVAPTTGPAHLSDLLLGDRDIGGSSSPAAVAGYPSITVPGGFVAGLPFGISFIGRAWSEPVLIRLAYAFEQATRVRRPPRFMASAGG